jgi:RNA-binding motif X-linked protein 2
MDINMPRDKDTGKPRGFAFLMYEDQRSTVLAVDNLNGAKVLERVLRVDHVKNYKQKGSKNEDGDWIEPEEQSLNAKPQDVMGMYKEPDDILPLTCTTVDDNAESESDAPSGPDIDPEDPMYEYLVNKRKQDKALKKSSKSKSKTSHADETPEERRARKERKKAKKEKKRLALTGRDTKSSSKRGVDQEKSIEELLRELEGESSSKPFRRSPTSTPPRRRSRSPTRTRDHSQPPRTRTPPGRYRRDSRSPSRTPPRGDPSRNHQKDRDNHRRVDDHSR